MKNTTKKVDLRKQLKHLYSPSASEVEEVDVPKMNFIMTDGKGDPNQSPFRDAINALYNLSYTLKFTIKKEQAIDYPVMALEGLWWTDVTGGFSMTDRDAWKWTAMIMQPEFVTTSLFRRAVEEIKKKKDVALLADARLKSLHEGLSAQIMHVGPYSVEATTIERLHNYIRDKGYELRGKHHEVYLGDPRRAAPSKLRTILRQPFTRNS